MAEVTITSKDGSKRVEDGKGNVISRTPAQKKDSSDTPAPKQTKTRVISAKEAGGSHDIIITSPVKTTAGSSTPSGAAGPSPPSAPQAVPAATLPAGAVKVGSRIRYQGLTYSEKDFYAMQERGQTVGVYDDPNKEEIVYKSKVSSIIGDHGEYNPQTGELSLYAPKGSEAYGYISGVIMAPPKGIIAEERSPGVFFIGKPDYSQGQSGYEVIRDSPAMGSGGGGSGGAPPISNLLSGYGGKTALPTPYIEKMGAISAARVAAADSLGIGTNKGAVPIDTLLMRYALKNQGSRSFVPAGEGMSGYSMKRGGTPFLIPSGQGYSEGISYFTPQKINPAYVMRVGLFEAGKEQQRVKNLNWMEKEQIKIGQDMGTIAAISNWATAKTAFEARAVAAEKALGGPAGVFTGNFIRGVQETASSFISAGLGAGYFYKPAGFFRKQAEAKFITDKAGAIPAAALYGYSAMQLEGGSQIGTFAVMGKWIALEGAPRVAAGIGVAATAKAGIQGISGLRQTIGGIEYGLTYKEGSILSKTAVSGERVMFAYSGTADMSLAYGSKGKVGGKLVGITKESPLSNGFFFQETWKVSGGKVSPIGANILGPEGGRLYNIPGGFESPNVVARGFSAVKINKIGVGGFTDDAFYSYSDDLAYSGNLGGFDKYAKAMDYWDDTLKGATHSPITEETRYLLSDTLGKEGWKGGQYLGQQYKGQGFTFDFGDEIVTYSTGRPTPYITQSYTMKAGKDTNVFLGTVQTGEGAFKFQGYNVNIESFSSSAKTPMFGGVMKSSSFFDDVALGGIKVGEGTQQLLKGAVAFRPVSPPPSLLGLQSGGGTVAVAATKTMSIQPSLVMPQFSTQQKSYDVQRYDGAFSTLEAPRSGLITAQKTASALRFKPIAGALVGKALTQGVITRPVQSLKIGQITKPVQGFKPTQIFRPLSGTDTKGVQIQSLKISAIPITKQTVGLSFEPLGSSEPKPPPPPGETGGEVLPQFKFSQFAFPGGSRVQGKSGKQSKGYKPSVLGKLIGFTIKKTPTKTFKGSEIRPMVLSKGKKKKKGWWFN